VTPGEKTRPVFLTAEWRWLLLLNYDLDPRLLADRVPAGTELDAWNGRHAVSLVGFRFLRTRVLGIAIPFHRDFEEVNLRFYVRRRVGTGWRRGVVFVRELVPRLALAAVARGVYGEPYSAVPMRHAIDPEAGHVAYSWRWEGVWCSLAAEAPGEPALPSPGSDAEFITEHFWGYTRTRSGKTREYGVEHPPWPVRMAERVRTSGPWADLYGPELGQVLEGTPRSTFVAEGSPIVVRRPTLLGR
jgi:uncharacterized protein YqjF (DUF2071 family)